MIATLTVAIRGGQWVDLAAGCRIAKVRMPLALDAPPPKLRPTSATTIPSPMTVSPQDLPGVSFGGMGSGPNIIIKNHDRRIE